MTSFFALKGCIEDNSSWESYCGPLVILGCMLAYPLGMYVFCKLNEDRLDNPHDKYFQDKHRVVFGSLRYYRKERMGLGFILIIHYRRLFYSFVIVFLIEFSTI